MKAFNLNSQASIYFHATPVRMNYMMDGLAKIVQKDLQKKPLSGDVFLFVNKKGNYLKALYHNKNGYCIFAKRLDPFCRYDLTTEGAISAVAMQRIIDNVVVAGKTKLKRVA